MIRLGGWSPWNRISALKSEALESFLVLLRVRAQREGAVCEPGRGPSPEWDHDGPETVTPSLSTGWGGLPSSPF